ncbi:Hypothetical predicted protein [Octopus vulgaris]|uniref:Uncharacterized protein n=1 Tax=Octopus vulgaris TaxID=6645 RepID=A0AA36EW85_OCTVU|nr:Hypothetical predicted protein [Octopus vulgaris]
MVMWNKKHNLQDLVVSLYDMPNRKRSVFSKKRNKVLKLRRKEVRAQATSLATPHNQNLLLEDIPEAREAPVADLGVNNKRSRLDVHILFLPISNIIFFLTNFESLTYICDGGGASTSVRGVIGCVCAGASARAGAVGVAVVIAGAGTGPVTAATIGAIRPASVPVVRSATVNIREAFGKAGVDGVVTVADASGAVRGVIGAANVDVANVVR